MAGEGVDRSSRINKQDSEVDVKNKDNLQEVKWKTQNYLEINPALLGFEEPIRDRRLSWIAPIQRNAGPACPSLDDVQEVTRQKLQLCNQKEYPGSAFLRRTADHSSTSPPASPSGCPSIPKISGSREILSG
jgi:hypothetical protein